MVPARKTDTYFSVTDCFGKKIRTTRRYWQLIVDIKHPSVKGKENQVKITLESPDFVKHSKQDLKVFLYYKKANKYYFCVVARHENGNGFIITAYMARSVISGEKIWEN